MTDSKPPQVRSSTSSVPPPSERRAGARHLACFPAAVEPSGGAVRTAFIRDLSVTGAQLLTLKGFAVGEVLTLSLYLTGEPLDKPRVVVATVVRDERRDLELAFPWTNTVAVKFNEPVPDLEVLVEAIADEQNKTFGARR